METNYPVRDRIEYIIAFINEFGQRFGLTDSQAYRYLKTYGAIGNIDKHYGALHTQISEGMWRISRPIAEEWEGN